MASPLRALPRALAGPGAPRGATWGAARRARPLAGRFRGTAGGSREGWGGRATRRPRTGPRTSTATPGRGRPRTAHHRAHRGRAGPRGVAGVDGRQGERGRVQGASPSRAPGLGWRAEDEHAGASSSAPSTAAGPRTSTGLGALPGARRVLGRQRYRTPLIRLTARNGSRHLATVARARARWLEKSRGVDARNRGEPRANGARRPRTSATVRGHRPRELRRVTRTRRARTSGNGAGLGARTRASYQASAGGEGSVPAPASRCARCARCAPCW